MDPIADFKKLGAKGISRQESGATNADCKVLAGFLPHAFAHVYVDQGGIIGACADRNTSDTSSSHKKRNQSGPNFLLMWTTGGDNEGPTRLRSSRRGVHRNYTADG